MKVGDRLEVTNGPFTGFTATILAITGDQFGVELDMFGRATAVTLTRDQLTPPDVSMAALEREVVDVIERGGFAQRIRHFWNLETRRTPPREPAERAAAFAAWVAPINAAQRAAQDESLARFRAAFAGLDDAARATRWRAEQAAWTAWREQAKDVEAELDAELFRDAAVDPETGEVAGSATIADEARALRDETDAWERKMRLAAPPEPEPRNEALEQQIERDVMRDESFLVYGDWLQANSHPRGELIAMTAAGLGEAEPLRRRLEPRLLGPLAGFADRLDVRWRLGYVDAIHLEVTRYDEDHGIDLAQLVSVALRTPSLRFLRDLEIALPSIHEDIDLQSVLRAAGPRPALRRLALLTNTREEMLSWTSAGELSGLAELYPQLTSLEIESGRYWLTEPRFPHLERLELRTCEGTSDRLRAVAEADWPVLAALEMWFGSRSYNVELAIADFAPLLVSTRLPALRSLALCNCELTDELCAAVLDSPLLPRLTSLFLAMGTMTEVGARTLIRGAARLQHLVRLDVDDNYLDESVLAELQAALPQVTSRDQRTADVYEGVVHRYAAVGE